jgi:hypothetical protein
MAWEIGDQKPRKSDHNINQEIMETEGYLDEREAKILLYRFLRENVSFTTKMLMGVELFPFQHISIKGMMLADYFLGIWSRGLSKSFSTGVFAALYAILEQGVSIGIISKSFRQSKMIFSKIEDIANDPKAELFRQAITNVRKSNDEWTMTIGKSTIRAMPLGDGEKLRGYRFHVMIIDELLLMPEKIINEVILPFLGVVQNPTERQKTRIAEDQLIEMGKMKKEDRTVFQNNKLIGLSSASYKFEYLYKLYSDYENLILNPSETDSAYRIITHFAYDIAPEDLYDQNLLEHAKATMSSSQFEREFGAKFTDDSSGYFKISKMMECTLPDGEGQSVQIKGDEGSEYLLAIDPSWSESESSDDFAMQIIKIDRETGRGILVHSYAMSGTNLKKHISYMLYVLDNFNIVSIVMDYNGGLQFLNSVNESAEFADRGIKIKTIESDFDDPEGYQKACVDARSQYNKKDMRICVLRKPSSIWIRNANESLQAAFDHKKILFAGMALDRDYHSQIEGKAIEMKEISFSTEEFEIKNQSNTAKMIDFLEIQKENVELTKTQCAMIEVSTSPQGTQSFDLPLTLRKQSGRNKARKDSYSALILANWMMGIHFDVMVAQHTYERFKPRFVK